MTRVTTCVLLCAAALLAGCRLDADVDITVEGDGQGTVAYAVAADEDLLAAAAASDVDPLATLEQAAAELDGWEARRTSTPTGDVVTLTTSFRDAAELERVTGEVGRGLSGPELAPLGALQLDVGDDTVALSGSAALEPTDAVAELGLSVAEATDVLAESASLQVVAHLPGTILDTNADEQPDERTAVWTVPAGQRRTLSVTADRPWSLARIVAAVGGPVAASAIVLGVLVLAAVLLWMRSRRRGDDPAGPGDRDGPGVRRAGEGGGDRRRDDPDAGDGSEARRAERDAGGDDRSVGGDRSWDGVSVMTGGGGDRADGDDDDGGRPLVAHDRADGGDGGDGGDGPPAVARDRADGGDGGDGGDGPLAVARDRADGGDGGDDRADADDGASGHAEPRRERDRGDDGVDAGTALSEPSDRPGSSEGPREQPPGQRASDPPARRS